MIENKVVAITGASTDTNFASHIHDAELPEDVTVGEIAIRSRNHP
jgi:hypothetical protein